MTVYAQGFFIAGRRIYSTMKYGRRILKRALECADLPEIIDADVPQFILTGREKLTVCNHRGILRCDGECMRFVTGCGVVCVVGTGLTLHMLTPYSAFVYGNVTTVGFEE